jgi:hypothetical protein
MKKITIIIFMTAVALFAARPVELGFVVGEPTGLSARFPTGSNSIDLHFGSGYGGGLSLHGAYLFHTRSGLVIEGRNLPFYYGPRVAFSDGRDDKWHDEDDNLGIFFDLGLNYMFREIPFNMFFELAPGLRFGNDASFDIAGGIGFRYVFGRSQSNNNKKQKPKGVDVNW